MGLDRSLSRLAPVAESGRPPKKGAEREEGCSSRSSAALTKYLRPVRHKAVRWARL